MTTKTTFHLSISRPALAVARVRAWLNQRDPIVLIASVILPIITILIIAALWRLWQPAPPLNPLEPIILIATAPAAIVPTLAPIQVAAQLPNTLTRAVVAYDAPEGHALGAIEQGRAYAVLARFGADWLQADVVGSGAVWLRSADVFDLPSGLTDLQPPPAPQIIYQVVNQEPAAAVPTPAAFQAASAPPPDARQAAIQARLANEHAPILPTDRPMPPSPPTDAQREWAQQQWRDEHCIGDTCIP